MTSDLSLPLQPSRIRGGDYVRSVDVYENYQRSSKPPLLHRSVTPQTARRPLPDKYVIVDDQAR
jgi:hypothetical protein